MNIFLIINVFRLGTANETTVLDMLQAEFMIHESCINDYSQF